MQVAGFQWDDGNWPKCGKHGLSKAEIEAAFANNPAVHPNRVTPDGETRYAAIGRVPSGRHVFVVFTLRTVQDETLIRPISARPMHQREIIHYERRNGP